MILPNKYVTLSQSFIGLSALLLDIIGRKKMTIDKIWDTFYKKYVENKKLVSPPTFEKIIYTLDFMYMSQMVSYTQKGEIYNENL